MPRCCCSSRARSKGLRRLARYALDITAPSAAPTARRHLRRVSAGHRRFSAPARKMTAPPAARRGATRIEQARRSNRNSARPCRLAQRPVTRSGARSRLFVRGARRLATLSAGRARPSRPEWRWLADGLIGGAGDGAWARASCSHRRASNVPWDGPRRTTPALAVGPARHDELRTPKSAAIRSGAATVVSRASRPLPPNIPVGGDRPCRRGATAAPPTARRDYAIVRDLSARRAGPLDLAPRNAGAAVAAPPPPARPPPGPRGRRRRSRRERAMTDAGSDTRSAIRASGGATCPLVRPLSRYDALLRIVTNALWIPNSLPLLISGG